MLLSFRFMIVEQKTLSTEIKNHEQNTVLLKCFYDIVPWVYIENKI